MSVMLLASIVIPTYNRSEKLINCLAALDRQGLLPGSFEVLVVNDGSKDDTLERLKSFHPAHYYLQVITQRNSGPSAARNAGVRLASAPIVLFTDDDCQPDPDWVEQLASTLSAADPAVAGCGGLAKRIQDNLIARYIDRIGVLCPQVDRGRVLYLITCNVAFRRPALLAVDGFCEDFVLAGGEDPDLCVRIAFLGYTFIVQPAAIVKHDHPATFRDLFKMYQRYAEGMMVTWNLGRSTPAVPDPYPGSKLIRHLRSPDLSFSDSIGFLACEIVKVMAIYSVRLKAWWRTTRSWIGTTK
jgi:glycosyltransferase involved in cell wall biosynthesis